MRHNRVFKTRKMPTSMVRRAALVARAVIKAVALLVSPLLTLLGSMDMVAKS